jgi:cyclic-di-GMP phosphodiesterase, flagellum assembly factor TipF
MSRLNRFMLVTIYAIAAATLSVGLIVFSTLKGLEPWFAGALAFLMLSQIHGSVSRGLERKQVAKGFADLNSFITGLSRDLERSEAELDILTERFEGETKSHNDEIVTQMRLIEGFVKKLAEEKQPAKTSGGAQTDSGMPLALDGTEPMRPRLVAQMNDVELLDTIREALEDNRVDLYLQPIVTLPQRKVRYYEALTRLRGAEGEVIMPGDYMRVAEPAGMMPTIDNLLLFRCVQVVRKLNERDANTGVFCNISANSLLDSDFFPQFVEYMQHNQHLSEQLVFEFSQETVNSIGPIETASLEALAKLGFRFSMDQVSDINIDYRKLHNLNIRYVKISAAVLVGQADHGTTDIRPEDIKELMARYGMNLIVDMIEKERSVVDVLDFNVDFGQGYLFGSPRPVRDEVLSSVA